MTEQEIQQIIYETHTEDLFLSPQGQLRQRVLAERSAKRIAEVLRAQRPTHRTVRLRAAADVLDRIAGGEVAHGD